VPRWTTRDLEMVVLGAALEIKPRNSALEGMRDGGIASARMVAALSLSGATVSRWGREEWNLFLRSGDFGFKLTGLISTARKYR
jgi:hypothetical protein